MSQWVKCSERVPPLPIKDHSTTYNVVTEDGRVISAEWVYIPCAKSAKGKGPRWEWNWRLCPWVITHWQPLPDPPNSTS